MTVTQLNKKMNHTVECNTSNSIIWPVLIVTKVFSQMCNSYGSNMCIKCTTRAKSRHITIAVMMFLDTSNSSKTKMFGIHKFSKSRRKEHRRA